MEITIINEELFRENSPIKEDTILSKFAPYVGIAQKMYIERILGKPLMDELKAQVAAAVSGTGEVSPANKALIRKVAPALSFYAVYQGIPFHWAAIVNKGVTVRDSENSRAVDIKDIAQLRRWIKDDAEELARDLTDYLAECRESYPLWRPLEWCGSAESTPDTGVYIPKKRG